MRHAHLESASNLVLLARVACRRGARNRALPVGAALSGNSWQALDRCRERSLLERVPGGFRASATARFTLAGVNRASFLRFAIWFVSLMANC